MTASTTSLILGINGHAGAYLARLLQARGHRVLGTLDSGISGPDAIAALGIAGDIETVAAPTVAAPTPGAGAIYAFNSGSTDIAAQIDAVIADPPARLIHVVDRALLPATAAAARRVAALRDDGRHAATAILSDHDSRLGSPDTLPARITGTAFRLARGEQVPPLDLVESGPRDWGWTPEYVDAIHRLAGLDRPRDLVIASGHAMTTAEFVAHAFAFFKLDPAPHVRIAPGEPETPEPGAATAAALKAATGWSASTYGRDLVRALCEGAAGRA